MSFGGQDQFLAAVVWQFDGPFDTRLPVRGRPVWTEQGAESGSERSLPGAARRSGLTAELQLQGRVLGQLADVRVGRLAAGPFRSTKAEPAEQSRAGSA
jgi:hypothetical protein